MEYEGSIVEDDNNPHPQAVYVVGIMYREAPKGPFTPSESGSDSKRSQNNRQT